MAVEYRVRMRNAYNQTVHVFADIVALEYSRGVNRVGSATIILPEKYTSIIGPVLPALNTPLQFGRHYQFEFWRKSPQGTFYLEGRTSWLNMRPSRIISENGERYIRLKLFDLLWVLKSRIVAYDPDDDKSHHTAPADDVIIRWFRDAFTTQVYNPADRDLVTPGYLEMPAMTSTLNLIAQDAAFENLLSAMQESVDRARRRGFWISFDFDTTTGNFPWRFGIQYDQRSTNRAVMDGSVRPIILSVWNGCITQSEYEPNYEDEITVAYSYGQDDNDQWVAQATDADRIATSPFGRVEAFEQSRDADNFDEVLDSAGARLEIGDPKRAMVTTVEDTRSTQYGRDFFFGDRVWIDLDDVRLPCRMDSVVISYRNGREKKKFAWEVIDDAE